MKTFCRRAYRDTLAHLYSVRRDGVAELLLSYLVFFFFSSRRRHTRFDCDWSSDVCSSDLTTTPRSHASTPWSIASPATPHHRRREALTERDGSRTSPKVSSTPWSKIGRASCRERV